MAGRGIHIIVQLLDGSDETGKMEEMSLPVALHSPLLVLKEQLNEATGIPSNQQVLILCDLTDKERNNDRVLSGMDFMTLRECGIKSGNTLTLHSLGLPPEVKDRILREAEIRAAAEKRRIESNLQPTFTLETSITAAKANHSYAGIIFDIHVKGAHQVTITSFGIGGMLGRVRIYARSSSWEDGPNPQQPMQHEGWTLVGDMVCRPNWDRHYSVPLSTPFTMLPHSVHGFYIHSSLPGDLGIQYQSYSRSACVAQDDVIALTPGIGHAVRHDVTSCQPFDHEDSWYRAFRCLAGTVSYQSKLMGWNPQAHMIFPQELRACVVTMLRCQLRTHSQTAAKFSILSDKHIIYNILEFVHWDWFAQEEDEEEESGMEQANDGMSLTLQQRLQQLIQSSLSENGNANLESILGHLYGAQIWGGNGNNNQLDDDDEEYHDDEEDDADYDSEDSNARFDDFYEPPNPEYDMEDYPYPDELRMEPEIMCESDGSESQDDDNDDHVFHGNDEDDEGSNDEGDVEADEEDGSYSNEDGSTGASDASVDQDDD